MQVRVGDSSSPTRSPSLTKKVSAGVPNVSPSSSVGADVPVSELVALAESGATLNRKQRRAVERLSVKPTSSAEGGTKPAVSAAAQSPETANAQPTSASPKAAAGETLAELKALHASGTPLNRKQRRAFARLSKD